MSITSRRTVLRAGLALLGATPLFGQAQGAPIKLGLIESLSGPFANTGEAVFRNLAWAIERVNARDVGFDGRFYTFYGNALGAPAAIGDAGIGKVVAVADWLPNVPTAESAAFYKSFRERFPKPQDDYVHLRMQLLIEALAQAIERAGGTDPLAVARALESADVTLAGQRGRMRAADHQFQQPLAVGVMDKAGTPGVPFDVEGSGYGFRVVRQLSADQAGMPHSCKMVRPG